MFKFIESFWFLVSENSVLCAFLALCTHFSQICLFLGDVGVCKVCSFWHSSPVSEHLEGQIAT
jgi:hypothetical protein